MSWQKRLRDYIDFTSPGGDKFRAKWKGDTRTIDKKVAEFDFPDFDGTIAQDLGTKSRRIPLTFSFEGENHDKETKKFEDAIKQRGRWDVIHPTIGPIELQPVTFSINDNPTESGNITTITSEWFEPAEDFILLTDAELAASVKQQTDSTTASAAGQANNNVKQNSASQTAKVKSTALKAVGAVQKTTQKLAAASTAISARVNQVIRSIQDTVDGTLIPMLQLAGQIKELILLPQQVSQDFESRVERYNELFTEALDFSPDKADQAGKNTAAVQEIVLTSTIAATANICVTSDFDTKSQALVAAQALIDQFNNAITALDATQSAFSSLDIDDQFFSQSQAYSELYNLIATALKYLLVSSFNLSVEKKITLTKPTIPAEIVIQEYGELGENDIFLDQFISINKLKKDEILVMPAGKEVVVYV